MRRMLRAGLGVLLVAASATSGLAAVDGSRATDPLRLDPDARVVVVAPNPDDETIAAGGLVHRLARRHIPVHLVFVTSGDGYPEAVRAQLHGRAPSQGRRVHRKWILRQPTEAANGYDTRC